MWFKQVRKNMVRKLYVYYSAKGLKAMCVSLCFCLSPSPSSHVSRSLSLSTLLLLPILSLQMYTHSPDTHTHTHTHTHTQTHTHTNTHNYFDRDKTAQPIYPQTLRDCVRALMMQDTPESIRNAFTILTGFLACGRTTEVSFVVLEDMMWDPQFSAVFLGIPQMKVAHTYMIDIHKSMSDIYISIYLSIYIYIYIHTYIHTYTYTYMHI